ncbi:MAG: hypothetical protein RL885_23480 [Planctomycetota bacterium]
MKRRRARNLYWLTFASLWLAALAMTSLAFHRWQTEARLQASVDDLLEQRTLLFQELSRHRAEIEGLEQMAPFSFAACPEELDEGLFVARLVRTAKLLGNERIEYRFAGPPAPLEADTGDWRVARQYIDIELQGAIEPVQKLLHWIAREQERVATVERFSIHRQVPSPIVRLRLAIFAARQVTPHGFPPTAGALEGGR